MLTRALLRLCRGESLHGRLCAVALRPGHRQPQRHQHQARRRRAALRFRRAAGLWLLLLVCRVWWRLFLNRPFPANSSLRHLLHPRAAPSPTSSPRPATLTTTRRRTPPPCAALWLSAVSARGGYCVFSAHAGLIANVLPISCPFADCCQSPKCTYTAGSLDRVPRGPCQHINTADNRFVAERRLCWWGAFGVA